MECHTWHETGLFRNLDDLPMTSLERMGTSNWNIQNLFSFVSMKQKTNSGMQVPVYLKNFSLFTFIHSSSIHPQHAAKLTIKIIATINLCIGAD